MSPTSLFPASISALLHREFPHQVSNFKVEFSWTSNYSDSDALRLWRGFINQDLPSGQAILKTLHCDHILSTHVFEKISILQNNHDTNILIPIQRLKHCLAYTRHPAKTKGRVIRGCKIFSGCVVEWRIGNICGCKVCFRSYHFPLN